MDSYRQLRWVWRNRRSRLRREPAAAGTLVRRLVERVSDDEHGIRGEIAAAVAGCVDAQFRRHCRIVGVQRGALLLHVDRAGLVWPMRTRWASTLTALLASRPQWRRIKEVRFAPGRAGVSIPDCDEAGHRAGR